MLANIKKKQEKFPNVTSKINIFINCIFKIENSKSLNKINKTRAEKKVIIMYSQLLR